MLKYYRGHRDFIGTKIQRTKKLQRKMEQREEWDISYPALYDQEQRE